MITKAQRMLLQDKYDLWLVTSKYGDKDRRDYNLRACEALRRLLSEHDRLERELDDLHRFHELGR